MPNLVTVETYECPIHGLEAQEQEITVKDAAEATLLLFRAFGEHGAAGLEAFRTWERAILANHDVVIVEMNPDEEYRVTVVYTV